MTGEFPIIYEETGCRMASCLSVSEEKLLIWESDC